MASSIIGALRVTLGLDSAEFETGSKRAIDTSKKTASAITSNLSSVATGLKLLAGGATAAAIIGAAKAGLDYASSLGEVAQQLGVTTKDLQVFRYAASQVGISNEEMDKGLAKLTVTIGKAADGSSEQVKAFRELGLSATTANGTVKTAGQLLPQLADALAKVKDPATRARIELEFFGKTGQKLDTLLSGGSSAIDQLTKAATDLGLVLTPEQIANADNAADKLAEVKQVLEANIAGAVANNAKAILDLAQSFETLVVSVLKAISSYGRWADMARLNSPFASEETKKAAAQSLLGSSEGRKELKARNTRQLLDIDSDPFAAGVADNPAAIGARKKALLLERKRILAADRAAAKPEAAPVVGNGALPVDKAAAASAAKQAAADAKRRAAEALRAEDKYQSDLGRARSEFLGLQQQLTSSAGLQANYAHQQIDIEADARDRDLDLAVQERQLSGAAAAELKLRYERNDELKHSVVNLQLDVKLAQDELDLRTSTLGNARDILTAQSGLAKTSKDRLALELAILDNEYDQQRAQLEATLASRDATEAQKKIAQARLDILDQLKASDVQKVTRQNEGSGAAYLRSLQQTPGQIAESIEGGAVDAVKSLNDQLTDTIGSVFKLKGAFGSVANSIISDLVRIAVQKNITGPLANLLFGEGSSGGGGLFSSIGKVLGLASGAPAALGVSSNITGATSISSGIDFGKLPRFATGGSFQVGGRGGIDKNLVQFAATKGEMVNIRKGGVNDNKPAAVTLHVEASPYFDARVSQVASPLAQAAQLGAVGQVEDRASRRVRRRL